MPICLLCVATNTLSIRTDVALRGRRQPRVGSAKHQHQRIWFVIRQLMQIVRIVDVSILALPCQTLESSELTGYI